jgi:hypothetical protein
MSVPAITLIISDPPMITWSTNPQMLAARLDSARGCDKDIMRAILAHLGGRALRPAIAGRLITVVLLQEPGTEVLYTIPVGDLVRAITRTIGADQDWLDELAVHLEAVIEGWVP